MTDEITKTNKETKVESGKTAEAKSAAGVKDVEKKATDSSPEGRGSLRAAQTTARHKRPFSARRGPRARFERPKPEFDQKIIKIRRVTRVVAGGRRFSFSVAMIIGDRKGSVGLGMGKASDTALAIEKAMRSAKQNLRKLRATKSMSIPHDVKAKFCSSVVLLMPNKGKGVVAGSSVRDILNLAGMKDVSAKILSGSKNKLNNARAALKALSFLKSEVRSTKSETPARTDVHSGGNSKEENKKSKTIV